MARVEVRGVPHGSGYRPELYHRGAHIGEYESSYASGESSDRTAKVAEAEGASDRLLEAYRRHGGKIAVRWNDGRKEIRAYQENRKGPGMGGTVLAFIPKPYRRRP